MGLPRGPWEGGAELSLKTMRMREPSEGVQGGVRGEDGGGHSGAHRGLTGRLTHSSGPETVARRAAGTTRPPCAAVGGAGGAGAEGMTQDQCQEGPPGLACPLRARAARIQCHIRSSDLQVGTQTSIPSRNVITEGSPCPQEAARTSLSSGLTVGPPGGGPGPRVQSPQVPCLGGASWVQS